jgi:flavocytochrome c
VERIVVDAEGKYEGVEFVDLKSGTRQIVRSHALIIATGGYGYHVGSEDSLLHSVRPDLAGFPTTNGNFATGDGIRLATAVGAGTVDLEHVQVHPTAFVDPADRKARVKTWAAELLRGVGAVILDAKGQRFVNELEAREHVSEKMMAQGGAGEFLMVLNEKSAKAAPKHIPMYMKKGLLTKYDSLSGIAKELGVEEPVVAETMSNYDRSVKGEIADPFGRTTFNSGAMSDSPAFYAGWIQPAIHYSMGGIRVDKDGLVLGSSGDAPVLGGKVYAVGEAMGGIHGENRLGGNALTECTVFGRHVGKSIVLASQRSAPSAAGNKNVAQENRSADDSSSTEPLEAISPADLSTHSSKNDCWVGLYEKVYDFTDFVEDHPGGADSITNLCGREGTKEFEEIHSESMLEDFDPIGELKECEEKCSLSTTSNNGLFG